MAMMRKVGAEKREGRDNDVYLSRTSALGPGWIAKEWESVHGPILTFSIERVLNSHAWMKAK